MALYLDLKVGECLRIAQAEITVIEKTGKNSVRVQIEADKDEYPVSIVEKERVKRIWEGPPIFACKDG